MNLARAGIRGPVGGDPNQLVNTSEEAGGLKLSAKTVLAISLIYLGAVVVLHIFGKVKSVATGDVGASQDL